MALGEGTDCRRFMEEATSASTGPFVLTLNVQSIRNKFDEMILLLSDLQWPSVVLLTEIWINSIEHNTYNIDGYVMHAVSDECSASGGVALYIRKEFSTQISILNCTFHCADALLLSVQSNNTLWHVLGIYRSPSKNVNLFLAELEEWLMSNRTLKNVIITGDFNINLAEYSGTVLNYLDCLAENGYLFYRVGTTRPSMEKSSNQSSAPTLNSGNDKSQTDYVGTEIDHFVTNSLQEFNARRVECSLSDHFAIFACCKGLRFSDASKINPNSLTVRKVNWNQLDARMTSVLTEGGEESDIEEAVDALVSGVANAIAESSYRVNISGRARMIQEWMTPVPEFVEVYSQTG
jgi:hypothetical protein